MGIFDRVKRVAKANVRSALGRLGRDRSLERQALDELDRELAGHGPEDDPELATAYRRLELPYGVGPERIQAAYEALVSKYRPDKFAGDPDRVKLAKEVTRILTEAYETLQAHWERRRSKK